MCGIVGYIGSKDVVPVLVDGLRRLEYRGYDSAGVAVVRNGAIDLRRSAGKLSNLESVIVANPIPAEGQCKLDRVDPRGSVVTWAMTCNSPRGPILSAGSGRYAGDTMEATLTARVPGPNGQAVDTPGHITGRYLGVCDAK